MGTMRRSAVVSLALALAFGGADAQEADAQEVDIAQEAYFRAVAEFFDVPSSEIDILRDWRLAPDEIPVVLFFAEGAGVAPEALVALRRSGESWTGISDRYGVGAAELHLPLPDQAAAGPLSTVYRQYRDLPANQWREIRLDSDDILALVNVRLLSQTLGVSLTQVLSRAGSTESFVQLYGELIR